MVSFKRLLIKATQKDKEEGQGLVEYALIMFFVVIVVIAVLIILGPQVGNLFSKVTSGFKTTR